MSGSPIERLSGNTVVLALAAAALFGYSLLQATAMEAGPALFALVAASLALELSAAPIPQFGFFRGSPAAILATAFTPGLGVRVACLVSAAGLLLRTIVRGRPEALGRIKEGVVDAVADLGGLAAFALLADKGLLAAEAAAVLSWAALALLVPGVLAAELGRQENEDWGAARDVVLLPTAGVALLAPGLAALVAQGAWQGLWLLPALWILPWLVGRLATSPRQREQKEALHGLKQAKIAEERTRVALEASMLETHRKGTELGALEEMTRILTRAEGFQETVEATAGLVWRLIPCDSAAIFLPHEQGLLPAGHVSPHAERLEGADLLDLREPSVELAWERMATVDHTEPCIGERIFEREQTFVAALLRGVGVLYVGRESGENFTQDERHLLGVLCAQIAVTLEAARRKQGEKEALELHRRAHHHLQRWVDRLTSLLDGTRAMASTLDPLVLGERLVNTVSAVIPHEHGMLMAPGRQGSRCWPAGASLSGQAAEGLAQAVMTNRVPLLLEDIAATRFAPLVEGCRSLLAVPVPHEGNAWGAVLLGARPAGAFDREHQDILQLIAFLAAVCYSSSGRHQSLADAHRMLKESQAMLVQASKLAAVGQLAAGIAHELNTPLAAILLSLDTAELQLKRRPERAVSKLEQARTALDQARNIISKLLVYTRPQGTSMIPVELNRIAEDAVAVLTSQLAGDGVDLCLELAPESPWVKGNTAELQQVVTSLLMNARDAVLSEQATSRRVVVRTRGGAVLEVEDGGPGVAQEIASRIFDPFYTTKPVGHGMGLGLAIGHQVLLRHGGSLELVEKEGEGALFRMRLPAIAAPARLS
ncbi:MAG: GAF domain-containing protein [Armatimonadetes bacterium]|nr:GAF domain-containing protein [Armatimonadota bacterium]